MPFNVVVYSILPSPYQRDLFFALSQNPEVNLNVFYLEAQYYDSPWPEKPLQPYENVLPGTYLSWGKARFHWNWHLPNLGATDLVVLNGYQSLVSQFILSFYSKSIPCVFWGEKMVASSGGIKGQLQKTLAQSLNRCSAIAAIGSGAEEDYQNRFPNKPIFNIPYYCDLSAFSSNTPSRPREPVTILFCGQMIARKGIDILLSAFDHLLQSGLQSRLLLVGREAELPQFMENLPQSVMPHIEYAGFQSPDRLPYFFQQADLFVLPSRYDGWGVVVNQALGAGLPIICSDAVGAAYDLIEPGVNGMIVPAGDSTALTSALEFYVKNPAAIAAASQASQLKSRVWTPQVGAERWLQVFQQLTSDPTDL